MVTCGGQVTEGALWRSTKPQHNTIVSVDCHFVNKKLLDHGQFVKLWKHFASKTSKEQIQCRVAAAAPAQYGKCRPARRAAPWGTCFAAQPRPCNSMFMHFDTVPLEARPELYAPEISQNGDGNVALSRSLRGKPS